MIISLDLLHDSMLACPGDSRSVAWRLSTCEDRQGLGGTGRALVGAWLLGVAANYGPLSLHALALVRPGVLDAELADVDVMAELRHYTVMQLWVAVPLVLLVLAVAQASRSSQ